MAIQNVVISLVLRSHSLGSQLLREHIRKGIPARKPVSSLSYRRMKGRSQMTVLVPAAFVSGGFYSTWQSGTCSSSTLKMKLPKKVKSRKKIAKGIKADLPVRVGGYKILGVNNCDLWSFKMRWKCSESRDKDTPSRLYRCFCSLSWRSRELGMVHCTTAWLQEQGELILAARWNTSLNKRLKKAKSLCLPTLGSHWSWCHLWEGTCESVSWESLSSSAYLLLLL